MHRLPARANQTQTLPDGRLIFPAAERNSGAICDLVTKWAPSSGHALELASGAGQHVVRLARALPGLVWQPTDLGSDRIASIDAHAAAEAVTNVRRAQKLDATRPGWSRSMGAFDLILLVNLLHLISRAETDTLIEEAGRALAPGGVFILYGPFMRNGKLTSPGDERFHAELTATDPQIGYKNDRDVASMLHANWLDVKATVEMPANNLAFIAARRR